MATADVISDDAIRSFYYREQRYDIILGNILVLIREGVMMRYVNLAKMLSVLVLSLLSLKINTSFAGDVPVNLQGGGAQALNGYMTVTLDSEVVKIILGKKSYTVDAVFAFSNIAKTVDLNVGFPKNGSYSSDFIKFETWVDEKQVNFIEKPYIASIAGRYTLPELIRHIRQTDNLEDFMVKDNRWMVMEGVPFPSNRKTTIRARYVAPYQDFGAECDGGLKYIYGTGLYWKGNIRESKFIVDATGLPEDERPKDMMFIDQKDRKHAECSAVSDGVIQCVLKDYKPAGPDAGLVVFLGDGCVYRGEPQ